MVDLQQHVTRLLGDVTGDDVLEFGNKKNPTGIYRDWYLANGAKSYCSVDFNGMDGALELDVQQSMIGKVPLGSYSLVTNFGFSEHVQKQEPFWTNAVELTSLHGRLVCACPAPQKRKGHGHSYWHPSTVFYEELAIRCGFGVARIWADKDLGLICVELVKASVVDTISIPVELIWENPQWKGKSRPPPKTAPDYG